MINLLGLFYKLLSHETQARLAGVKIGSSNFIASRFWSSEPYLIEIGSNCQITNGVKFFTHGGAQAVRHLSPKFDCFGKIKVGNYVYLGTNSMVLPGVTIEDNVLIAAGSVVTNSIPTGMVVGGNPARIICTIEEYLEKNAKYNLDSKGMSREEKRNLILSLQNDKLINKRYLIRH